MFLAALGLFFMVMSYLANEARGAFSKLPGTPPSRTSRVIVFGVGLAAFVKGIHMMFKKVAEPRKPHGRNLVLTKATGH